MAKIILKTIGLDCPNCAKKIENKIASMEKYKDVIVNFSTLTLSFKYSFVSFVLFV